MTTKGDNKKQGREEAERLLIERLPTRIPAMSAEFDWACGLPGPAPFRTPPLWVRDVIRHSLGIPDQFAQIGSLTREDLSQFFGFARGLLPASAVALNQPFEASEANPQLAQKLELFRGRMVTAMQPSLDGLKNAIKRVPEEKFQQNLGEVVAGHKGQTAASEFVHNALDFDTTEEPITEQIHWFLWMF